MTWGIVLNFIFARDTNRAEQRDRATRAVAWEWSGEELQRHGQPHRGPGRHWLRKFSNASAYISEVMVF